MLSPVSTLLGLLPLLFGAVAVAGSLRARRPVLRSLGLNVSRWSPLEVIIGLAITFLAIGLTFTAELALGAVRLEPGSLSSSSLLRLVLELGLFAAIEEVWFRVLLLSGLAVVLSPGLPGMLARFVVIGLVVLYLSRRWPSGRFATLTYAPDP